MNNALIRPRSPFALPLLWGALTSFSPGCFSNEEPPSAPSGDSGGSGDSTSTTDSGPTVGASGMGTSMTTAVDSTDGGTCGDGVVDEGELCDDGNTDDSDECTVLCLPPSCDDGIVSGNETDADCGGECDECGLGLACIDDADCGSANCYAGACADECVAWTRQYGTSGDDAGRGLAIDGEGSIYVSGWTGGSLDGEAHAGDLDIFFSKFLPDGTREYTRQFGSVAEDRGAPISVDANGDVVVGGFVYDSADGIPHLGAEDGFIAKLDSVTTVQWAQQIGTMSSERFDWVAFSSDSKIYIGGNTTGAYGPHEHQGEWDMLVLKLNEDGSGAWSRQLGTAFIDEVRTVATTSDNGVVFAGHSAGAFEGGTPVGGRDAVIGRFDSDGVLEWTGQYGSPGNDEFRRVALAPNGDVVVAGYAIGSFEGNVAGGDSDVVVMRLGPDGAPLWSQQFGSGASELAIGVAVDLEGTIYISGSTAGNLNGVVNTGGVDFFVIALDADGNLLWTQLLGSAADDGGTQVEVDNAGRVTIAGLTNGTMEGANAGENDIVVVRLCDEG